jgi:ABC-type polar amino acid transport system ATPase subunit
LRRTHESSADEPAAAELFDDPKEARTRDFLSKVL